MLQKTVVALLLPLLLQACATRKGVTSKPLDSGVKAVYAAPFDKVKKAVFDSLSEMTFTVKEDKWDGRSENCYLIVASQGLSSGTLGRYCRVVIEKSDGEQTVYVLMESKVVGKDAETFDESLAKDFHSHVAGRIAK